MKKVKLYGLPHCSTCQKAVAYLEDLDVEIENFHDVKENQLSKKEVQKLVKLVGGEDKLFSKRAMKYRSMGLNEMELSNEDLLNYMVEEYTFIRRPVLVFGDTGLAGFSKKKYDELFK
jgi:arsenate reductase